MSRRRSRRRRNELPLGFRLLVGGIVMLVVSLAFAELGLPGLSDLMGLLAFIGFWMAAGGFLILVAPVVIALGKALFARLDQRVQSYWISQPSGKGVPGSLQSAIKPSWDLGLLRSLDWKVFEDLSANYVRETGFRCDVTPLGADGGVDIWVYSKDKERKLAAVQCKAWNTWLVGVKPVRELYGVMAAQDIPHGMFVTTGVFTEEATAFAAGKSLKLIDGATMLLKIRELPQEAQDRLMEAATSGDYKTPSCPKCGNKMLRRTSSSGQFWGCPSFPRCRGKLSGSKNSAAKG